MSIHNKKNLIIPASFSFKSFEIEVVSQFKLLGVIIDNKLNFTSHVSNLKATINKKLNPIKQLFFLSKPVKIQFFKTFILPHFDYCLSLVIYFSKPAIQSLSNAYYISIFKLIHLKAQILKNPESPLPLETQLIVNESLNKPYNLRNSKKLYTPGSLVKINNFFGPEFEKKEITFFHLKKRKKLIINNKQKAKKI
ncbi:hypothetical protein BpHYR1_005092 [Brachionus plicatilis]|uniref:RNA-directed DNA polymerase from mobile element jockey-like n=1 Tax=Brachionus plicatilis TaxID=10195 RepID=A0A3M7QYC6_BRAPC|nr:hypothetical protein BpHYR1_005092 [Brachionus plicatilis]